MVSGSPNAASGIATPNWLSSRPEPLQQQVQRQRPHADREQDARHEHGVEELPALELVLGQRQRRHRPEHQGRRGRDGGDQRAVAEELPERRRRQDGRCSSTATHGCGQPAGAVVDVAVGAEAVHHDEQQRHDGEPDGHDGHQVGGRHDRPPAQLRTGRCASGTGRGGSLRDCRHELPHRPGQRALGVPAQREPLVDEREHEAEGEQDHRDRRRRSRSQCCPRPAGPCRW